MMGVLFGFLTMWGRPLAFSVGTQRELCHTTRNYPTQPGPVPSQMPLKFLFKKTDLIHPSCLTEEKNEVQKRTASCPRSPSYLRAGAETKNQVFWLLALLDFKER